MLELESIITLLVFIVKAVAGVLSLVMILCIILIVRRVGKDMVVPIREILEEARDLGELPKNEVLEKWKEINRKVNSSVELDYREAVIEADEFLDKVLKTARFSGEELGDRLKMVRDNQLEFKEDIIWADDLKKKIVADENFKVSPEEAKRAVYIFERALKEMGVL